MRHLILIVAGLAMFVSQFFSSLQRATAAAFEKAEDEGPQCFITFKLSPVKHLEISSLADGGVQGQIWLSYYDEDEQFLDDLGNPMPEYSDGFQQSILFGGDVSRSFFGVIGDYSGAPSAEIPLSLVVALTSEESWTLKVAANPPIRVNDSISQTQYAQFLDCVGVRNNN